MDTTTRREVYLLDMREALANMEHANRCAARDEMRGAWSCDWSAALREAGRDYQKARELLLALPPVITRSSPC